MSDKPRRKKKSSSPAMSNNPRFQRLSRKKNKVQVGDRFARMFTDADFQDEVPSLPTDKYGIKRNNEKLGDTHISKIYEYNPESDEDQAENETSVDLQPEEANLSDQSDGEVSNEFQWDEESSSTDIEEEIQENLEESEVCCFSSFIRTSNKLIITNREKIYRMGKKPSA